MNYIKYILPFLAFLFVNSISNAQKFEGVVTIKSSIPKMMKESKFTIKGDLAMLESQTPKGKIKLISNNATGEKLTITELDGNKVAIKKNGNETNYQNTPANYGNGRFRDKTVKLQVTRETKKIDGYKCYKVIASDSQYEGVAWITKDLEVKPQDHFPILKSQQRILPKVAKALQGSMEGFVMEMTLKDIKSKEVQEVIVQVEKKSVEENAFQVSLENTEVYDAEKIRELLKESKGDPEKMKKARALLGQMRMQ